MLLDILPFDFAYEWIIGQLVTLDIKIPPPPAGAPLCRPIKMFQHFEEYVHSFMTLWPISVGRRITDDSTFQIWFHHYPFHQFTVIAAISKGWLRCIQICLPKCGFVLFRAHPSLGVHFAAVDTLVLEDTQARFHGVTDSDILPSLQFLRVKYPISYAM